MLKKYRIEKHEGESRGDVYELEITTYFNVIECETGRTVMSFSGIYSAKLGDTGTWDEGRYTGVENVVLSEDDDCVLVYYDKKDEPVKIYFSTAR